MQEIKNITLIGAGNVATHLGLALREAGLNINQVFSRSVLAASQLSGRLNCSFTTDLKSLNNTDDLYILSIPDDAVLNAIEELNLENGFVAHTSGSLPMEVFSGAFENYGVFYPLQTFSKTRTVEWSNVPICLEASSPENLSSLNGLAKKISGHVKYINSDKRKILHLAAVFACNFPNYLYSIAEKISAQANLEFDLLKPLILETAMKVQTVDPQAAQTGPALRGDKRIMEAHKNILKDQPEIRDIYEQISKAIEQGTEND